MGDFYAICRNYVNKDKTMRGFKKGLHCSINSWLAGCEVDIEYNQENKVQIVFSKTGGSNYASVTREVIKLIFNNSEIESIEINPEFSHLFKT